MLSSQYLIYDIYELAAKGIAFRWLYKLLLKNEFVMESLVCKYNNEGPRNSLDIQSSKSLECIVKVRGYGRDSKVHFAFVLDSVPVRLF